MSIKKGVPLYDQADENGFWGKFGGNYLPEPLLKPADDLHTAFQELRHDKNFLKDLEKLRSEYIGRPTPFFKLENLTKELGGAEIWIKHEAQCHGDSHKLNGAIISCLIAKYRGQTEIIGDTGAGMAGTGLAMAASRLGLKSRVFMGKVDYERQKLNVMRMKTLGCEVVPVTSGSQTLVEAVSETMRYWLANCDTTAICVGSVVGASVFVKLCAFGQHVISREMSSQMMNIFGEIPKATLVAAVGGGSSSFGFFCDFIDHDQISMRGVEAGGPENDDKLHAAPLTNDSPIGILHGAKQYVIQSPDGQIQETSSIAAGLDYPGVSPMHCYLKDEGRVTYTSASDEEAVKGFEILAKTEGIQCSIEPAHAIADICRIAPKMGKDEKIIGLVCGTLSKDAPLLAQRLNIEL